MPTHQGSDLRHDDAAPQPAVIRPKIVRMKRQIPVQPGRETKTPAAALEACERPAKNLEIDDNIESR